MTEEEKTPEPWIYVPCPICAKPKDMTGIPCEGQIVYVECHTCEIQFKARMPSQSPTGSVS